MFLVVAHAALRFDAEVVLYAGLAAGMPAGLASLVLQASAPFTILLAAGFLGERLTPRRALGVGIAVAGLALIGASQARAARQARCA